MAGRIETLASGYAEKAAAALGYEVVDVEYVKEGGNWVLRVYIDKDGGISTEDCEKMSRSVETMLDGDDPIENPYSLEVCSPGLDRLLKKDSDFERFKGRLVDIKLYKSQNGAKKYHGELLDLTDGVISILDEKGDTIKFLISDAASVRLAVVF